MALFLWIVGVSIFSQAFFWTLEQMFLISGFLWPTWVWFTIAIVQGLALLVPAALLALFWPSGRLHQIALLWAIGAVYVLLMSPMRLVRPPSVISANVIQIGLTLLAICLLIVLQYLMGRRFGRPRTGPSLWVAILIASMAAYPWLMWGALGSAIDTLLNLTASMLFGLLAALVMNWFLLRPLSGSELSPTRIILIGGLATVGLMSEMSSAFGFGGLQLLLLVVVPSFGLASSAIYFFPGPGRAARGVVSVAALVGLLAAAPAMLVDPDELTLVLAVGARDLLQWALYAAFASAFIGWTSALILIGFWSRFRLLERRPVLPVASLLSLVLGIFLYFAIGQPGFHGDQLFVIMKDQAELTTAAGIDDVGARREFVYRSLVNHARLTQSDLTRSLDRLGIDYQTYYLVNSLKVDGGPLLELWLNSRPEVDRVLHNPVLRPLRAPTAASRGLAAKPDSVPWNLQFVGADKVWQDFGVTGQGVIIGQSDSGVDGKHTELAGTYRGRSDGDDYNWYDPWRGSSQPIDMGGHGTHTLGTVLGVSTGVAPGAEWIGCVNLARNLANPSLYLDCLQFMLAPFPQAGDPLLDGDPSLSADVLNNSWGCPPIEGCDPNALLPAARALRQAGIFVVVSAGNEGPFCESVSDPLALYDEVLSVGAVDDDSALAFFSSVGPVTADGSQRTKPDLLAPGVAVLSAFPGDTYEFLDGTSMAGPHLTGVVALMWSANPALRGDVDLTEQILLETARPYQGQPPACGEQQQLPYNGTGYGIVDAYSAVKATLELSD